MLVYECLIIMLMLCKSSYARLTPEVLQGRSESATGRVSESNNNRLIERFINDITRILLAAVADSLAR